MTGLADRGRACKLWFGSLGVLGRRGGGGVSSGLAHRVGVCLGGGGGSAMGWRVLVSDSPWPTWGGPPTSSGLAHRMEWSAFGWLTVTQQ